MFIDAHCDTATAMLDNKKVLKKNDLHFDLTRAPKEHTQIFAAYIAPEYYEDPMSRTMAILKTIKKEIEKKTNKAELCTNSAERAVAIENGNMPVFLSLENAIAIQNKEDVKKIYDEGVRFVSLTWNDSNHLAGGVLDEEDTGLSVLGRRMIYEMEKLGMIIDVSHLNDHSFWDVARVTNYPIIASHSCSRTICKNPRNLTDEQFKAICVKGGVVGINFYSKFLVSRGKAEIKHIVKHIDHFLKLGGENHIGLGSDFDGMDSPAVGLEGVEALPKLIEAFRANGYSQKLIDKICYGNFERVMRLL